MDSLFGDYDEILEDDDGNTQTRAKRLDKIT